MRSRPQPRPALRILGSTPNGRTAADGGEHRGEEGRLADRGRLEGSLPASEVLGGRHASRGHRLPGRPGRRPQPGRQLPDDIAAPELGQLQAGPDQPLGQAQAGRVVVAPGGAEGEVPLLQLDQVGMFIGKTGYVITLGGEIWKINGV
jgi:hypothetical protein